MNGPVLLSPRCNDEIASVGKCIDLLCVAAYRGTKIKLTETFDTSFPFWGLIDRHTNTVYFHILCVVSEPLCLEMDKNVQGLFTIPVSALFFFVMSSLEIVYFIILFVAGGKAYGLLKNYQEEKLNSVNEVKL